ncbi:uncharacterized protein SCDLUD_003130 [Saccharomycodes ludwigii]|uniref:uncharacterized protein n=1 Tax=Saccharomycodes ludwigii TaxID=36035 RepID=UPI001E897835|nr:hypothetical protein SCDLUD_003130 [Saccharomycodes ludwigii]KAH3900160.1 hypothetical protein SCDLUD_003130 [Saccharomycodes ludwigii]
MYLYILIKKKKKKKKNTQVWNNIRYSTYIKMPKIKHIIHSVTLYNIQPPSIISLKKNKQVVLFQGDLLIFEDFELSSSNSVPKCSLILEFIHTFNNIDTIPHIFCRTSKIDNLAKFDETIVPFVNDKRKYKIIMTTIKSKSENKLIFSNKTNNNTQMYMRIPLELRVGDQTQQTKLADLFSRIRDEFELIEEMYYT